MEGNLLLELTLIFALAGLGGLLATRAGLPAVVGELLAGVIAGPHALGLVRTSEPTRALAEVGVVFLLFEAGLAQDARVLVAAGKEAALVALGGVIASFLGGLALGAALGGIGEGLFLGAALVATSVGVTARVLQQRRAEASRVGRVVLGAAILDDILGLLLLALVTGAVSGATSVVKLGLLILDVLALLGATLIFLLRPGRRLPARVMEGAPHGAGPFVVAAAIGLALSLLTQSLGLAPVVGAFFAGLILAEAGEGFGLKEKVEPLVSFLAPFFFFSVGAEADPGALTSWAGLGLALLLTALAVAGKVIGSLPAASTGGLKAALAVGWGMVPRGEVGLVVASAGMSAGVFQGTLYSAVISMVALTTILAPPLFARALNRAEG